MEISSQLPKFPEPYWRASVNLSSFPQLNENIKVDVAIVGGGITGITTAFLLIKKGIRVAIVEGDKILNGTTGHTTAKITQQHGLLYDELINHFGEEKTHMYYEANLSAMNFIKNTVEREGINCHLTSDDAYIYTNSENYINKLDREYKAYLKLGIRGEYLNELSLPIEHKAAISMKNQYHFHPLQYLAYLADEVINSGGLIFEGTTAKDIEKNNGLKVRTKEGYTISCDYIVCSSHYPFYDGYGHYYARMYAERSYVLATKIKGEYPGGMYINAEDPSRSLRYINSDNDKIILIAGENHKAGKDNNILSKYESLRSFGDKAFGIREILYRWSTQDLTTLDKIPYIGKITSKEENIFIATGYRKWGMTNGTAAALILSDLVLQNHNPYAEVFSPTRFVPDPSIKNFVVQNIQVAESFVSGKLNIPTKDIEDLNYDEGAIVMVGGQRAGVYRDNDGNLHILDITCTHMGCELQWNDGERSWDCPCHGSRFSFDGDIIEGPALKNLENLYLRK